MVHGKGYQGEQPLPQYIQRVVLAFSRVQKEKYPVTVRPMSTYEVSCVKYRMLSLSCIYFYKYFIKVEPKAKQNNGLIS